MNAWETAALGLGLGAAAALFDSPSLYIPAIALCLLAPAAAAWVALAARGATLTRDGGPVRVIEGERAAVELRPRSGRLPPPGGEVTAAEGEPIRVGPRGPATVPIEINAERRGRWPIQARWTIRDPLGLCRRHVEASGTGAALLILPRIEPLIRGDGPGSILSRAGVDAGAAIRAIDAAEAEIDGLRPYREGSPASRIHWPAVARSGELVERRLIASDAEPALVILDARRPADAAALDRAVRAAGSICVFLAHTRGGCRLMLPGHANPHDVGGDLRGWPAAHEALAVVAPGPGGASRMRLAGADVFVVTASAHPGAVTARNGAGRSFLVTAFPRPDAAPAFTVAGCSAYAIGRSARREVAA